MRHWFLFTSSEKDFSLFLKKEVHQEGSDDKSLSRLLGGSNEVTSLFKAFAMLFGSAPHRCPLGVSLDILWLFISDFTSQSHCFLGCVSLACVSRVAWHVNWFIRRCTRSPSPKLPLSGIFLSSHSLKSSFPGLLVRKAGVFSPFTWHMLLCSSPHLGLPSGQSSERKERERRSPASPCLFRPQVPLASFFSQRDGLFLWFLGSHNA